MEANKNDTKTNRIIYRISTWLLALFILPGIFFLNSPMATEWLNHVWPFPQWFALEAGIWAFIWWLLLIIPRNTIWARPKERAYVWLGIVYISAFIAHTAVDWLANPMTYSPLVTLAILIVSYIYFHKTYGQDIYK